MLKEKINLKKLDELTKNNPLSYEVMVYDVNKGRRKVMKSKPSKKKHSIDEVWDALIALTKSFDSFKQEINVRLDYIVDANKLKDLPKTNR